MIQKMIVMLLSVVWGRIQERIRNFGHLVHERWSRTCVRSVFKYYEKQMKSENHETCWDVVISYVEAMIKIWEGFVHVVTYDAYKSGHLYMCPCKFTVMFREQDVRNFGSVPGYGPTLHSVTWLSFFESLNSIIRTTCSSKLYFLKKFK